jgi:hypothetical protein
MRSALTDLLYRTGATCGEAGLTSSYQINPLFLPYHYCGEWLNMCCQSHNSHISSKSPSSHPLFTKSGRHTRNYRFPVLQPGTTLSPSPSKALVRKIYVSLLTFFHLGSGRVRRVPIFLSSLPAPKLWLGRFKFRLLFFFLSFFLSVGLRVPDFLVLRMLVPKPRGGA